MLAISSEKKVVIAKREWDETQQELKKLRARDRLSQELQKGLLSALSGKVVPADSVVKKLGFSKYES